MYLSQLVDDVVTELNAKVDDWKLEDGDLAKAELDPMLCLLPELGVYIVPNFVAYAYAEKTRGRQTQKQILRQLTVSLIVAKKFVEIPAASTEGVCNWSEGQTILDTRQKAEEVIINYQTPDLTLVHIEPQELAEAEIDNRNFVAITSFTYEECS